jgi:hypothetical protein
MHFSTYDQSACDQFARRGGEAGSASAQAHGKEGTVHLGRDSHLPRGGSHKSVWRPDDQRDPDTSALLSDFFRSLFHVNSGSPPDQFPGLPLVMSLLDTAFDRRKALHPQWDPPVSELRQAVELRMFDLLEEKLYKAPTNNHWQLLQTAYPISRGALRYQHQLR